MDDRLPRGGVGVSPDKSRISQEGERGLSNGIRTTRRSVGIRHATAVLEILAIIGFTLPVLAQQSEPNRPVDPDASAMHERTLLQQAPRIEGRIDIPDKKSAVLIQPAGREWEYFHEVLLHWLGAIVILGMIALLGLAYLIMGRIRISAGRSGRKVTRFSGFERFSHWLTAVSFVVLGLTGLNITFGKLVLRPVIGPEAFTNISQAAKYVHNFTSFSFVIGLILIITLWIKDNIPRKVDVDWVKQGGGFIKSKHAPAGRFNAGEKLVFWFALGGGLLVIVSGYFLLFPFYVTNIEGMQIAQVVHAIIAVLFVAVILAHIYIGTLGMEGAFEAMGTGEVDLNWASEHHDQWLQEKLAAENLNRSPGQPPLEPAE
jgi:formate dehydrogenase subunit gamma